MLDNLLGLGSVFDWLTPALSILSRAGGKTEGVTVPDECYPWLVDEMKQAGVKVIRPALDWPQSALVFDVPSHQLEQARAVLRRHGLLDEDPARRGLLGWLDDLLDW